MKKMMMLFILTISLLTSSFTAFAGDIPESLLHSDDAKLFFGEVIAYYPDKEIPEIEVIPVKNIKGEVIEGTKLIFLKPYPMGNFKVKEGKIYLFTYLDKDNTTDIFEVTSYDTRTLKLKNVSGSMWERFELYLNEGRYGEAVLSEASNSKLNMTYVSIVGVLLIVLMIGYRLVSKKRV